MIPLLSRTISDRFRECGHNRCYTNRYFTFFFVIVFALLDNTAILVGTIVAVAVAIVVIAGFIVWRVSSASSAAATGPALRPPPPPPDMIRPTPYTRFNAAPSYFPGYNGYYNNGYLNSQVYARTRYPFYF